MVSEAALHDLCFNRAAAALIDSTLQTVTWILLIFIRNSLSSYSQRMEWSLWYLQRASWFWSHKRQWDRPSASHHQLLLSPSLIPSHLYSPLSSPFSGKSQDSYFCMLLIIQPVGWILVFICRRKCLAPLNNTLSPRSRRQNKAFSVWDGCFLMQEKKRKWTSETREVISSLFFACTTKYPQWGSHTL